MSDPSENCQDDDPVKKPHDWNRVVDAAAALAVGATLEEAAKMADCSVRSITSWKKCSWWEDEAMPEAIDSRLTEIKRFAMKNVLDAMREGEDTRLAWDILDRLEPRVPDDEQKIDHTSSDGSMSQQSVIVLPDNGRVDSEDSSNEE